jgi:hypothetical protein
MRQVFDFLFALLLTIKILVRLAVINCKHFKNYEIAKGQQVKEVIAIFHADAVDVNSRMKITSRP